MEDGQLKILATEQGVGIEVLRALLATLSARAGADQFYVFWTPAGSGGAGRQADRQRTLLAFRTPDGALAFAQRNQLSSAAARPRLRRLSILQLVQALLREPAIAALLFVADQDLPLPPPGQLPAGLRVERAELIRAMSDER